MENLVQEILSELSFIKYELKNINWSEEYSTARRLTDSMQSIDGKLDELSWTEKLSTADQIIKAIESLNSKIENLPTVREFERLLISIQSLENAVREVK
jgi:hypothetical protein